MSSLHVFITGGTGFVGRALCRVLDAAGCRVTVLSRQDATTVSRLCGGSVRGIASLQELHHIGAIDAVVNLAGESIAEGRWTSRRKDVLRNSRIELTRQLSDTLSRLTHKPSVLISGSAIGFYGDCDQQEVDETSPPGDDFAAHLCRDWEAVAREAEDMGIRVCTLRIGLVLDPSGGALQKMLPAFRFGLGGMIGRGQQWMSWIDRADLCRLILFLIQTPTARGPFNATAPYPASNRTFTHALGEALRRPTLFTVPSLALKLAMGEASSLLTTGQKVMPRKAMAAGFQYRHDSLESAFASYFS
jgi:uncharacterized protein (TIGR01777 family)